MQSKKIKIDGQEYFGLPLLPLNMVNKFDIELNRFTFSEEGAKKFNAVLEWVKSKGWERFELGDRGGIKRDTPIPGYTIAEGKTSVEIITLSLDGMFRFVIGTKSESSGISGRRAFQRFNDMCREHKVDLTQFAVPNGYEYKESMPGKDGKVIRREMTQECRLMGMYGKGKNIKNCHHIDLNSSFMSGIYFAVPELQPVIQELYDNRKVDPVCKEVLVKTYGFMQSKYCVLNGYEYALANLSKCSIDYNNKYIDDLLSRLRSSHRVPLMINSDGIWYRGNVYHDKREGKNLGEWKTDHTNCTLNIKSDAAYQYIENGKINVVFSGKMALEATKDRSAFEWDDIYNTTDLLFTFDEENGITYEKNEL